MDLSTIDGLELTDEQRAAIEEQAKADIEAEVKGLKSKNDELITEKRLASEKAEKARLDAEEKAREAELEKSRKANDLKTLEETLAKQAKDKLDEVKSQAEAYKQKIIDSKKEAVLAELAPNFVSPEAAKLVLKNMVNVSLGEDATSALEFKGFDGATVSTDSKSFLEWASNNDSLAAMMKPIESAGGGSVGNNGKNGVRTSTKNTQAEAAKKSGDVRGFLNASLNL
jgi:hypothetical protein